MSDRFEMLLSIILLEAMKKTSLLDWETNDLHYGPWGPDKTMLKIEVPAPRIIRKIPARGENIIDFGSYFVYIPEFALGKKETDHLMRQIWAMADEAGPEGQIIFTTRPGFGVKDKGSWPFASDAWNDKNYDEELAEVRARNQSGLIVKVNGKTISQLLKEPVRLMAADDMGVVGTWLHTQEIDIPWLTELAEYIDDRANAGAIKVYESRMRPFEGELIIDGNNDALIIISRHQGVGGYGFGKKIKLDRDIEQFPADSMQSYDDIIPIMYDEFKAGDPEHSKILLRDWLLDTDNGAMLRRDSQKEAIKRIIDSGVRLSDILQAKLVRKSGRVEVGPEV